MRPRIYFWLMVLCPSQQAANGWCVYTAIRKTERSTRKTGRKTSIPFSSHLFQRPESRQMAAPVPLSQSGCQTCNRRGSVQCSLHFANIPSHFTLRPIYCTVQFSGVQTRGASPLQSQGSQTRHARRVQLPKNTIQHFSVSII